MGRHFLRPESSKTGQGKVFDGDTDIANVRYSLEAKRRMGEVWTAAGPIVGEGKLTQTKGTILVISGTRDWSGLDKLRLELEDGSSVTIHVDPNSHHDYSRGRYAIVWGGV